MSSRRSAGTGRGRAFKRFNARELMASVWSRVAEKLRRAGDRRYTKYAKISFQVKRCGSDLLHPDNRTRTFCCRERGCPSCMTQRVAIPKRAILVANFKDVPKQRLWAIRFSLPEGRVSPAELKATKKRLLYLVRRLTQSAVWRTTFPMWAGCVHPEWKVQSEKNGPAGFWVHAHLVCESRARVRRATRKAIRKKFRRIVRLPVGQKVGDVIHLKRVRTTLDQYAEYLSDVRNLLPGYEDDQRGELVVKRMPFAAIVAFMEATRGMHRLVHHGLHRAKTEAALANPKGFLGLPTTWF